MQNPRIRTFIQNITLSLRLAEDREARAVASLINGCTNVRSMSLVIEKKSDNPFTPEVLCEAIQGMKALKNFSLIAGDGNVLLSRPFRKARLDYLHITNLWLWAAQFKLTSTAGQKLKDSIRTKTLDLRLFRPEHDDWNGFFPLAVAGKWLRKLILQWVVMPGGFLAEFASMLGREGRLEELHIDRCWYRTRTSLVLSDLLYPLHTLKTLKLGAESNKSPYTLAAPFLQQSMSLSPALEHLEILHLQKPLLAFLLHLLPVLPDTHKLVLPSRELAFSNVWDDRAFDGPLTKGNIDKRHVWLDDKLVEDWKLATDKSKRAELKQMLLGLDELSSGKVRSGRFIDLLTYKPYRHYKEDDEPTQVVKTSVQRFMVVAGQQTRLYG
jgi:hypothetical protein